MYNRKWSYKSLIKYISPSVFSMLFISLYTIIDGLFISRFVGTEALAAINIVYPIYSIIFSITIMFCVGGSVIVAMSLGAKEYEKASNDFSLITIVLLIMSVVTTFLGFIFIEQLLKVLGLSINLMSNGRIYAQLLLISSPFMALKFSIEYFLRVDDNAHLSFIVTLLGGIINIVLDYLFIVKLNLGVAGAGLATFIGIALSAFLGLYYITKYKNKLHFVKAKFNFLTITRTCKNGISEMVTELSFAIILTLFNTLIMTYAGYNGVAAYAALLYIFYVFKSVYYGITTGIQPVISYNIGANSHHVIKDMIVKTTTLIGVYSLFAFILMQVKGELLAKLFIVNDMHTMALTLVGMKFFSFSLLTSGVNIFCIGYFNAINMGKTALFISLGKSIFFMIPGLLLLSNLYGLNGIWVTTPIVELCTFLLILFVIIKNKIRNKRTHNSIEVMNIPQKTDLTFKVKI